MWLDYPKINRLNRTFTDLRKSEGESAKSIAIAAIELKFLIVSMGSFAAGWFIGRPALMLFTGQAVFLGHQYWLESKLKLEGRLQEPIEQVIANLPRTVQFT